MEAARKYRIQPIMEDAGERGYMIRQVSWEETWPAWRCDCNQPNDGHRYVCAYCGSVRPDADALG